MPPPLTIALVGTSWASSSSGGATFEDEVLYAVLTTPSAYRFVVYPASKRIASFVKEQNLAERITLVKEVREPELPGRGLRRGVRLVRRRARPLPFAALTDALRKAGAQCAWLLGGSLVPLDMPYVATMWDVQHRVQPWFPEVSAKGEWRERERLCAELVGRASIVTVGTQTGARELRDAYGDPAGAMHVIPLPTPSFAVAAGMRPRPARPADLPNRYLLYPAQFWAHKNHVTAVRVFAALNAIDDPPELICVGDDKGALQHVQNEAQALGVAHRLHLPGFVERQRLIALYQHAQALFDSSLFWSDKLPPLQGMALGCPVIAAGVRGAEEQIGDAGILVPPFDVYAYANAVRTLRESPDVREELVGRGRERARAWTTPQYVQAVLELIQSRIAPARALWS